jgi:diguanylate cyclase (GGDEF)-like protein/PAS domain S-box-containing protein
MLGQSEAELAGVETRSLTHPDDWPIVEDVARGALMGEYATAKYEARYLRGDGTYYWVLVHLTLVREPDGTPLHFFAQFEDIADRKRAEAERDAAEDQLRHQALHDALTGLPNRRALLARLELERERPDAGERRIGALVVDVDRFKLTNDSLGHDIGDALLEQIAPRLAERLGPDGLLARAGGDEFVALTGAIAGPDELEEIGNRLLAAFADPFEIGGHRLFVAASVGGALSEADAAGDAIFSEADTAMYHAKSLGGARVELFGHELRERVTRRMALENELRDVLERDELSVAYQPVVELATGKIIAAEALLRWRRRDGENVSPGEFISIAEDTGQINAIGAWVIERACEQAAAWSTDGSNIAVTVNVSARQLADRTICCELQRCLRRSGVEPSRIILEITESVLLGDSERAIETLTELRDTGVRLALDDFGTGYSSLAYLTRLPLDVLKLDRSFVSKLPGDDQAAAVTAAIMSMARGLELLVVAEGIEREEERLELLDLGCVLGQGYMFARPAPASELGQKPWSLDTEALLRAD